MYYILLKQRRFEMGRKIREDLRTMEVRDKLIDLYYKEQMSPDEICEKLKIPKGTFYNLMREFQLPTRSGRHGRFQSSPPCKCGNFRMKIIHTIFHKDAIKRLRWCPKCKEVFWTEERIVGEWGGEGEEQVCT